MEDSSPRVNSLDVQVCFTEADQNLLWTFLLPLLFPTLAALGAMAIVSRLPKTPLPERRREPERPPPGNRSASPDFVPELDKQGDIVCRAVGYTPWPVDSGTPGDRVRVEVGPINEKKARSYVFERLLPKNSELVVVTLPQRPLGVMLTWDERRNRVVVEQLAEGSDAGRREKKSKLDKRFRQEAVLPDDLVRGVTCTNLVYPDGALWGAKLPERHIVLYGVEDRLMWSGVRGAMQRGTMKDGPVTFVLERRTEETTP
ncbi:MAG: hypothetical protein WDW38_010149 [Sanguina aurantia]